MRFLPVLVSVFAVLFPSVTRAEPTSLEHGRAEHVVVAVWDGMRPDFVRPEITPNLHQLATRGVFFKNHHPVYISSTEVNGTAIATGAYPNHSGIIANRDYRPEIEWGRPLGTESIEAIRRGDVLTDGHYLAVPTVAEILQQAGFPTVVAGTKPVTLLQDRSNRRINSPALDSVMLFNGNSIPSDLLETLIANERGFPSASIPNVDRDEWTTKALTHTLWKKGIPKFSLLWLSEPDASQHRTSPGSDASIAALRSCDNNLGLILKTLEEKGVGDKTDIFVISDHGFSTVESGVDVAKELKKGKFKAAKKFSDPEPGNVLVVGLGGAVMLYVIDHDETIVRKLVRFLQGSDFAGVIFSRVLMEGTFPIEQVQLKTSRTSPDVIVALRWTGERNKFGAPGMLISDGGKKGRGAHASLSPFDMHNTLIASGPDFRHGFIDELPSGNADLAPTILFILGVKQPVPMDGRVLHEAFENGSASVPQPVTTVLKADCDVDLRHWAQYLKFTKMGEQIYFDEGNGESTSVNFRNRK